jgi:hypothetical protein
VCIDRLNSWHWGTDLAHLAFDEPLVRVGIGILSQHSPTPRNEFGRQRNLRFTDGSFRAMPLDWLESGGCKEVRQGGTGEELDVGAVEQTHVGVLERACQQGEPNVTMGDVRNADDDAALGLDVLGGLTQAP